MKIEKLQNDFREKVSADISLVQEGINRYRIFSPFMFDDGDHLSLVLKNDQHKWYFTDEGHTLMHLSYEVDYKALQRGNRQKIITNVLSSFNISDRDGELVSEIEGNQFADNFYSYVQGLIKITDVSYLDRERVRSTFWEDFKEFIESKVSEQRREFNYFDKAHDPESKYPVDVRINHLPRPLFIFAIGNDDKCRDVTINLHQYERWKIQFHSIAVFEDQEQINRKVLARFTDVSDKQFSSLALNKERVEQYLSEKMNGNGA